MSTFEKIEVPGAAPLKMWMQNVLIDDSAVEQRAIAKTW
jgi:hypothetical protein